MKALLLIEDDGKALEVEERLRPLGFDSVRYRNPLKALDNLDEVAPRLLVASASDFPRHWKIIAEVLRSARPRRDCVIVLLRGPRFDPEEEKKASALEVNAVVSEDFGSGPGLSRLLRLLRRFALVVEKEGVTGERPAWEGMTFLFSHPSSSRILGGRIVTMSPGGLSLLPSDAALVSGLSQGQVLEDCSLRVGKRILSLRCSVARMGMPLGLAFSEITTEERQFIGSQLAVQSG